ncbi:HAD-IA family hydrolase [Paenibacillus sp. R14(2021)]|uniref:HAD-IA family hydrolase n=1 Tax=Paenibacillus sp. R14(2021) TaxID=2859228 RepID=UPI00280C0336|nr:HAD-IA family hydrolase [Paenibacillus sp. R14(2021)]
MPALIGDPSLVYCDERDHPHADKTIEAVRCLYEFFEDIFDSQSIGFQKPSPDFFDYVTSRIKDFNRTEALIIGDSLNTDIKGGIQAGIDTCWVNGGAQISPPEIRSTYTITSLVELFDICLPLM